MITHTGGTEIAGGELHITTTGSLGTGPVSLTGGLLQVGASLSDLPGFSVTSTTGGIRVLGGLTGTVTGSITGAGMLISSGDGTLVLTTSSDYTGGTRVEAGTLVLGHAQAVGSGTLSLTGTGSLSFGAFTSFTLGGLAGTRDLALANASSQAVALTVGGNHESTAYSGAFSGAGSLTKTGNGTLTLSGASTHSGGITVRGGTLAAGAANAFSANSALFIVDGATVNLAGYNQTVGDLDSYDATTGLFDAGTLQLGGATLTTLTRVTNNWVGAITGSGHVVKEGAATANWSGANTFSGSLSINAGKLVAAAGTLSPQASVAIASGATLDLASHNQTTAGLAGAGSVVLGSAALTVAPAADTTHTLSGVISGTGSLVKTGAGTQVLSGSNTFSGGVTLQDGKLSIAADAALGASSGGVTFNGGTLATTAALTSARGLTFTGAGTIEAGAALELSGALTGAGTLTKAGAGTLTLSGNNAGFSGATSISAGTLQISGASALGSGGFQIGSGATLALPAVAFDVSRLSGEGTVTGATRYNSTGSGAQTLSVALDGSADLVHSGAGTLTLSGNNAGFAGATSISAGTLQISGASALGSGGFQIASGAALSLPAVALDVSRLSGTGSVSGATRYNSTDTGPQTLCVALGGSANLVHSGSGTLTLAGNNAYSGGTTVSAGTLALGRVNAAGSGALAVDGRFDLAGYNQSSASLSGSGTVALGGGTLTLNQSASTVFSGALSGSGGLVKNGAGTLHLTGANSFSGSTAVNGGTLRIDGSATSSAFTVNAGGRLSGTGSLGTLTIASGGLVAPGNSPGTLTTGSQIWNGGGALEWEINQAGGLAGAGWDKLAVTGGLTINATSANPFAINVVSLTLGDTAGLVSDFDAGANYSFTFIATTGGITGFSADKFWLNTSGFQNPFTGSWSVAQNGNTLTLNYTGFAAPTLASVPEPSTYAAIAGATALAGAIWRRRRRSACSALRRDSHRG